MNKGLFTSKTSTQCKEWIDEPIEPETKNVEEVLLQNLQRQRNRPRQ